MIINIIISVTDIRHKYNTLKPIVFIIYIYYIINIVKFTKSCEKKNKDS